MDDLEKLKQQMGGGTFTLNLMTRALKKFAASKGIRTSKYSKSKNKKSLLKRKAYKAVKQKGQM
jgi:molecular chaperone DnaK (HSP70)